MRINGKLQIVVLLLFGCSTPEQDGPTPDGDPPVPEVSSVPEPSEVAPSASGPQEIIPIRQDSSCHGCSISVDHIATLGSPEDPSSPFASASVARDTSGNYYVAPTFDPGEIAVYGPGGDFLRTLGRSGEGPGEFEAIRALMITDGSTLHVFSSGRHTVMSTLTEEVVSARPLVNHGRAFHVFDDGRVLQNQTMMVPGITVSPIHLYDPDGRRLRSFGFSSTESQETRKVGVQRAVSFTDQGQAWINPYGQYRLELWDTTGTHVKTFVGESPWMTPWTSRVPGAPYRAMPNARIIEAHEDGDGHLWVHGRVPDRNWQPSSSSGFYEDVYDSVLEVIDLASGNLLATKRFEEPNQLFFGFIADDLLYAIREGEFGLTVIDIWRVRLLRPRSRS